MQRENTDKNHSEIDSPLAMVMLDQVSLPPMGDLFQFYNSLPPIPPFNGVISHIESKGDTVTFLVGSEIGFISLMPAPIPWSDLEGPCATSLLWPESAQVLKPHKTHIVISIIRRDENLPEIIRTILLTMLTASVALGTRALGIYWPTGTVVHHTDYFVKAVQKITPDNLPLELWIDFRIQAPSKDTFNLITTGLDAFDLMEIEIINSKRRPEDLLAFVRNTTNYLIENGPVIRDGDTVGEDSKHKIKVQFKPSVWEDRPARVMRILY